MNVFNIALSYRITPNHQTPKREEKEISYRNYQKKNTTELLFSRYECLSSYRSFIMARIIIILGMPFTIHMVVMHGGKVLCRKYQNKLLNEP